MRYFLLAILCVTSVVSAGAQTAEPTVGNHAGIDARILGMGGAGIATSEGTSALYWNPAGLVQLGPSEFSLGLSAVDHGIDTLLHFSRKSTNASRFDLRLNHLAGVFPVSPGRSRLTIAIGIQRIQNHDQQTRIRGMLDPGRSLLPGLHIDEQTEHVGGIYAWRVGLAGRVSARLSLGGTFDIWTGDHREELLTRITDPDERAELNFQELHDTADRSYQGLGMSFGTLLSLHERFRLAAMVRMPMDFLEVDEYWTQNTFERNDDGTEQEVFEDGSLLYTIRLPIQAGVGLDLGGPNAHIAADVGFASWTHSQYSRSPEVRLSNQVFQRLYRNVLQWRVGGEYRISSIQMILRAGYWHHPLAFIANTITDERDFWSVGVGLNPDERVSIDIAYTQGRWQTTNELFKQTTTSRQITISSTYRLRSAHQ